MNYHLAKTDPDTYPVEQLEKDGRTVWDGVTNPQAVKAIRQMKAGDMLLIYHSGGESAIVALAKVLTAGRDDPKNPKSAVMDVEYVCRLDPPVTLQEIKQCGLFDDWSLVRQARLSTMAAPATFVSWMKKKFPGKLP